MRRFTPLSWKSRDGPKPRIRFLQINDKVKILAETLRWRARIRVVANVDYRLKNLFNQEIGRAPVVRKRG